MINVKFYSLLRKFIGCKEIEVHAKKISILELIKKISRKVEKDLTNKLTQDKKLITGTIILLNGRNIHYLDKLNTIVSDGDNINIFPPGGGG